MVVPFGRVVDSGINGELPTRALAGQDGFRTPHGRLHQGSASGVVQGGPHCITWTHAEEVNAELLAFLAPEAIQSEENAA